MEYPRKPNEKEIEILRKNKMRVDGWLVIWQNSKQIDFISTRSRRRRIIKTEVE